MVKLVRKFSPGDKVFAKVRGYPPWPAKIQGVSDPNTKNAKYNIYFYGTGETAVCKVDELFAYAENKAKFSKPMKRKFFLEGLQELEEDVDEPDDVHHNQGLDSPGEGASPTASSKEASAGEEQSTLNTMDSDAEGGPLIIDEGEKKKAVKRKAPTATTPATNASTPGNQDVSETKKKRGGRGKAATGATSDTPGRQEISTPGHDDDLPEKEVVSRSGRKIKPKRFADFSSTDRDTEKHDNVTSPRVPGKSKSDDSAREASNQETGKGNKTATADKKNEVDASATSGDGLPKSAETPGRFLLARTFAGEYVGIKLDVDRPKSFENENARAQWDWETARNAMKLKAQLENGSILPEQVKDSLDFNVHAPGDDKQNLAKDSLLHQKKYKLRWLRIESQLLQLDAQIKSNLGLDRADADKCLHAMDDMLALPIDPLMLKKHPQIVDTVRRLRRYIGNLAEWKLTEEEVAIFKQKAEQIKQKAEHIYNKFKAMFTISGGQTFWQSFSDQVVHFKELTKDMPEEKMFSLMSDPSEPVLERAFPSASTPDVTDNQAEEAAAESGAPDDADSESGTSRTPIDTETK